MTRTVRLATCNMQYEVPALNATAGLRKVCDQADVVCLQEWKPVRDSILARLGTLLEPRLGKVRKPPTTGWVWLRTRSGGTAVGARAELYEAVSVRSVILAKGRKVAKVAGRRSKLGNTRATEAVLRDRATGRLLTVYSFHLPSHVQGPGGTYATDQPERVAMHKEAVVTLTALVKTALTKGECSANGDTNFQGLALPPLTACWLGRKSEPTHGDAKHGRTIDYIYAPGPATSVHTEHVGSDHRAVIATYKEAL